LKNKNKKTDKAKRRLRHLKNEFKQRQASAEFKQKALAFEKQYEL